LIDRNVVDVHFDVTITDRNTGVSDSIHELHSMRYLFSPEVEFFLESAGFAPEACEEWMTGRPPGEDTWNVCYVARRC
jgi:hypothetical protein